MNSRIIAAFKEISKEQKIPTGTDKSNELKLSSLRTLAKQTKTRCKTDGVVTQELWKDIDEIYRMYYALKLESFASEQGIEIYQAKDQWIARRLLSNAFKNEHDAKIRKQNKKEKQKKNEKEDQVKTKLM